MGVGYYGQANCEDFNIYNGGYQANAPGTAKSMVACGVGGNTNLQNVMIEGTWTSGNIASGFGMGSVSEGINLACYNMPSSLCIVVAGSQIILKWGYYGALVGLTVDGPSTVDTEGIQSSVDIKTGGLLHDHGNSDINGLTMEGASTFLGENGIINAGSLNTPNGPVQMNGSGGNLPIVHLKGYKVLNSGTGGLFWWYGGPYGTIFDDGGNTFTYSGTMHSAGPPGNWVADGHSVVATGSGVCTSSQTSGLYGTGPNATTTTCTSATIGSGIAMNSPRTMPFFLCTSTASGTGVCNVLGNGSVIATCNITATTWCQPAAPVALTDGELISGDLTAPGSNTLANIKIVIPYE